MLTFFQNTNWWLFATLAVPFVIAALHSRFVAKTFWQSQMEAQGRGDKIAFVWHGFAYMWLPSAWLVAAIVGNFGHDWSQQQLLIYGGIGVAAGVAYGIVCMIFFDDALSSGTAGSMMIINLSAYIAVMLLLFFCTPHAPLWVLCGATIATIIFLAINNHFVVEYVIKPAWYTPHNATDRAIAWIITVGIPAAMAVRTLFIVKASGQ